jgi:16S rRNA U516 pseudouridylate synthase RsuA-like enzyme
MFELIGHPVGRLRRVRIGPIVDEQIPIGHWRELDEQELGKLRRAARLHGAHQSLTKVTKTPRHKGP